MSAASAAESFTSTKIAPAFVKASGPSAAQNVKPLRPDARLTLLRSTSTECGGASSLIRKLPASRAVVIQFAVWK